MAEENNEQVIEDDPIEVRRAKREAARDRDARAHDRVLAEEAMRRGDQVRGAGAAAVHAARAAAAAVTGRQPRRLGGR